MDQVVLQPEEYITELVKRTGLGSEQLRVVLQAQAEMANAYAERGFPIPGIGQIRVVSKTSPKPSALKDLLQKVADKGADQAGQYRTQWSRGKSSSV